MVRARILSDLAHGTVRRWCLVLLLALPVLLPAAECRWSGAGGDGLWSNGLNWESAQRPIDGDSVTVPGGTGDGIIDYPVSPAALTLDYNAGTVDASGLPLVVQGDLTADGGAVIGVSTLTVQGDLALVYGRIEAADLDLAGDADLGTSGQLTVSGQAVFSGRSGLWLLNAASSFGGLSVQGDLVVDGYHAELGDVVTGYNYVLELNVPSAHAAAVEVYAENVDGYYGSTLRIGAACTFTADSIQVDPTSSLDILGPCSVASLSASQDAEVQVQASGMLTVESSLSLDQSSMAVDGGVSVAGALSQYYSSLSISDGARFDFSAVPDTAIDAYGQSVAIAAGGQYVHAVRSFAFTDSAGNPRTAITPGEAIYLTLLDASADREGSNEDGVQVSVSSSVGDSEVVQLWEVGGGMFRNSESLSSASTGTGVSGGDGVLVFAGGDALTASYQDDRDPADLALATLGTFAPIAWTGAAGDRSWSTPGNWSTGQVPGPYDAVIFGDSAADACVLSGQAIIGSFAMSGGRLEAGAVVDQGLSSAQRQAIAVDGRLLVHGDVALQGGELALTRLEVKGRVTRTGGSLLLSHLVSAATTTQTWSLGELAAGAIGGIEVPAGYRLEIQDLDTDATVTVGGLLGLSSTDYRILALGSLSVEAGGSAWLDASVVVRNAFSNLGEVEVWSGWLLDAVLPSDYHNEGVINLGDLSQVRRLAASLTFTDGDGGIIASVTPGQTFWPELVDESVNLDGGSYESVSVLVRSPATGDEILVPLTEGDPASGRFIGSVDTATDSGSVDPGDGVLSMRPGENLVMTYQDPADPADRLAVLLDATTAVPVQLTGTAGDPTSLAEIPVVLTTPVAVGGLDVGDFTVDNGALTDLIPLDAVTWKLHVTADADGAVTVRLPAAAAMSDLGQPTAAASLVLHADTTAPRVAQVTGPGSPASIAPLEFVVSLTEAVDGLDPASIGIEGSATTGAVVEVSGSGGVYTLRFSGFEGPTTLGFTIAAGAGSDAAGNPSEAYALPGGQFAAYEATGVLLPAVDAVYDGEAHGTTASVSGGLSAGATVAVTYTPFDGDPAGGGVPTGTAGDQPPVEAGWYQAAAALQGAQVGSATAAIHIAQRDLTATADAASRPFLGPDPAFSGSLDGAVPADGLDLGFSTAVAPDAPVGSYAGAIQPTVADPLVRLANYAITLVPGDLVVTAADPGIVLPGSGLLVVEFDGAAQPVDPTYALALDSGSTATVVYQPWSEDPADGGFAIGDPTVSPPVDAGWYRVAVGVTGNLSGAAIGALRITTQPVTVTVPAVQVGYDGAPHAVTPEATPALAPGTDLSVTYEAWDGDPLTSGTASLGLGASAAPPSAAGWYAVTATASGNQSGSGSGSLRITPANQVTVAVPQAAAVYDGTAHTVQPVVQPALGGASTLVVTYEAWDGDPATTGTASLGLGAATTAPSAAGWYVVAATVSGDQSGGGSGSLHIARRQAVLAVGSTSRLVGAANPSFSSTFANLVAGDEDLLAVLYSTPADSQSPADIYPISATVDGPQGVLANYDLSVVPGILVVNTVGGAPVITSPSSVNGVEGSSFSYTITASGGATSFAAANLPDGLAVDAGTGVISGYLLAAGDYSATLMASNGGGTGAATLLISVAAPTGVEVAFTASSQFAFTGHAPVVGLVAAGTSAQDQVVLIRLQPSGDLTDYPAIVPATIPAGHQQVSVALPILPAEAADGTIALSLSGVVAGSPAVLALQVVGSLGDGEPLHVAEADGAASGLVMVGPQDLNLLAIDGVPPYSATVSGVAATVRPWNPMAGAYDLDGDSDPDLGQRFTVTPQGTGSLVVTITDGDGGSATFAASVQAGVATPVAWSVPVSPSGGTVYAAIGVAGFGGLDWLLSLVSGSDSSAHRAFIHSPAEGRWYELPALPSGGALPWDGCYLASRTTVSGNPPAQALGTAPAIPLYPGWNFIAIPPIADPQGSGVLTSFAVEDLRFSDETGADLSATARAELLAAYPIQTWDGSAFVQVDTIDSARGYFIGNPLSDPDRMLFLRPSLPVIVIDTSPPRAAAAAAAGGIALGATRPLGAPPAPPASAPSASAEGGGGCGIGSLGLILGVGLAWLSSLAGLRRRR